MLAGDIVQIYRALRRGEKNGRLYERDLELLECRLTRQQ